MFDAHFQAFLSSQKRWLFSIFTNKQTYFQSNPLRFKREKNTVKSIMKQQIIAA